MKTAENKRFVYEFGRFVLDPQEKTLFENGIARHLPAKEFETLLLLVENNGKALTKGEMMSAIWQDAFVEEVNLAKQISRLRKIFNSNGEKFIETLPKHGYRFKAELQKIERISEEPAMLEKRIVKRLTVKIENEFDNQPPALPPPKSKFLTAPRFAAFGLIVLLIVFGFWFWSRQTKTAKINSIAVLPLKSLNDSENGKTLGLGLTDTLITKIGNLRAVSVRPMSAVIKFADADALEAGKKLSVDAVLEGTIRESDGFIRVNVRLLRVSNGEQLWAEKFDRETAKVFDLEDRLSEQTAQALGLKLGEGENRQLTKRYTTNADAHQAYVRGRYFWNRRTASDLKTAINYFNEAIAKDPNYALAFAGLADAYMLLADYNGALPDEAYPKAKDAAMKALELDDELAEAHAALAYVKMYYYHDWQGAESEFRRAVALNPSYAGAHQWYAEYLTAMGRFDEALAETRRAKEIDPLSPIINAGEVWTLYFARRYDEGIERGRRIAELNPQFAEIQEYLKRCYDQKGMFAEAVAARQQRRKFVGLDATETDVLKEAAAATDPKVYWKKRLEQEIIEAQTELPEAFNMAEIYAQLGEKDTAFEWLEKAIERRDYELMYLRVAPNLDPLRSDPRFADALRRVGLLTE